MNPPSGVLAVTQGDPSGIGPDITLNAWLRRKELRAEFVVFGDPALYATRARHLGFDVPVLETAAAEAGHAFHRGLPVVPTRPSVSGTPGQPVPADAAATLASIEAAVNAVRRAEVAAVVTNPIAKQVLYAAGFPHPGHTEFLGELATRGWGSTRAPVMLLWSELLAVVPVTIHVPLAAVPRLLTRELIVETALTVHQAMATQFGIAVPRLACAGLNPHAGENGQIGREEIEVIEPALEMLRRQGVAITGPISADTMFYPEARATYDVALTMYHDQGLIPIKTLSFDTGVNVTLGLPFVRTSPDHGTAFALAGTGRANPSSLIAAMNLAARLARVGGPAAN